MTTGAIIPDAQTFRALARHRRVIPVTRRLLADGETPVGVYRKLAGGPGTFLLESAEQGAGPGGADFAFAPITVENGKRPLTVQVTGSFSVTASPGRGEQLVFSTNRRVMTTTSTQMPRDGFPDTQGTSRTTTVMPGPDDVLSFEMPPVRPSPGSAAIPDQFSLRVRIAARTE